MSGIFDAINGLGTDPNMMGLIGAAGGFAQAAMPQPYRGGTPFGAVLGMGAQGLGQGYGAAIKNRLENVQAQGGQLANAAAASALPMTLARNQMLANVYSNPGLMQQLLGGGAPASSPVSAPSLTAVSDASTPPNLSPLIQQSATKYGLPPQLLAGLVQQESSNGKTSPNLGQVLPSTAADPGYGMKPALPGQLDNPANNIDFTANYLAQRGKAAGVTDWTDPAQAAKGLQAYNGGGDPNYVQHVMRYTGGLYGAQPGAAAPQSAGSSDALAQYQDYEARAKQATVRQFFGLPTGEDPAVLHATAQQYLKLALAPQQAGAEAAAQSGPHLLEKGFTQDGSGNLVPVPGGPADPALIGKQKAAEAAAQAAADRTKLITTRNAVFDPVTGKEVYRTPEPADFVGADGLTYHGYTEPDETSPTGMKIIGGPPGIPPGTNPPKALSGAQEKLREGEAEDFTHEGATRAAGAYASNQQLDQLDDAVGQLNKTGWSSTGPGAGILNKWAANINAAYQKLGVEPPFDPMTVGSYYQANKIQTHLALEQSRMYEGAHPALGGIKISQAAIPGADTPEVGYNLASNVIRANNNREIALRNFETKIANDPKTGGNLVGADVAFNQKYPPQSWANWAQSQVAPVHVDTPDDVGKLLPGTYFVPPGWKPGMKPKMVPGDINALGQ